MKPKELNGEDMLKLQTVFHNSSLELSDVIKQSVEIISELTTYTSVVLGNSSKENKLSKVEVVPISDNKLIAIVITDKGHVENRNINLSTAISTNDIRQTVELINKLRC